MASTFRRHSLSIVMFGLFFLFLVGQLFTGYRVYNLEQQEHNAAEVSATEYLQSGHAIEAVFENWESEFLQMASYVVLTVWLFQKGSAESKPLSSRPAESSRSRDPRAPGAVRRGGLWLKLYKNSLGWALFLIFVASLLLHAAGGSSEACRQAPWHGEECQGMFAYMTTSQFWFESFQNWQSEFLAVGALAVLSIFLRQHGSPESKPVAAPHSKTGS